jgi:hypothetical protein
VTSMWEDLKLNSVAWWLIIKQRLLNIFWATLFHIKWIYTNEPRYLFRMKQAVYNVRSLFTSKALIVINCWLFCWSILQVMVQVGTRHFTITITTMTVELHFVVKLVHNISDRIWISEQSLVIGGRKAVRYVVYMPTFLV